MNQRILFNYWLCQDFYIVQMSCFSTVYNSLHRLFQKFFSEKGESVINIFFNLFSSDTICIWQVCYVMSFFSKISLSLIIFFSTIEFTNWSFNEYHRSPVSPTALLSSSLHILSILLWFSQFSFPKSPDMNIGQTKYWLGSFFITFF